MALFITFEGGEGCGKSTQTRILQKAFEKYPLPSILIREPGGTALGERVRSLLKHKTTINVSPLTELILFNASRSQLVSEVIQPALCAGKNVICDRFSDSTLAYQSFGRGLEMDTVARMNDLAAQGLRPNLTFLLDISPEIGLARKKSADNDRFESEHLNFHRQVRAGFLKLAGLEPTRWVIIDSNLPRYQIASLVWDNVSSRLCLD